MEYAKEYEQSVILRFKRDAHLMNGITRYMEYITFAKAKLDLMESDQTFHMNGEKYEYEDVKDIVADFQIELKHIIDELTDIEKEIKPIVTEPNEKFITFIIPDAGDLPVYKQNTRRLIIMRCVHFANRFHAIATKLIKLNAECQCIDGLDGDDSMTGAEVMLSSLAKDIMAQSKHIVDKEDEASAIVKAIKVKFEKLQPAVNAMKMLE